MNKQINGGPKEEIKGRWEGEGGRKVGLKSKLKLTKMKSMVKDTLLVFPLSKHDD